MKVAIVLSLKAFGNKKALEDVERVLEDNFTVVKLGMQYNKDHGNYEEWINIFSQEGK